MPVILRTHGGLGNQIFQVLYGRLLSSKLGLELREVHDSRYKHRFTRSESLRRAPEPTSLKTQSLSALRIPKFAQRITGRTERPVSLLGSIYIDGYFQHASAYAAFEQRALAGELSTLRSELGIPRPSDARCLFHLRLGDFFASHRESRQHAILRLTEMADGSAIMTNDEDLLAEKELSSIMAAKGCRLISTSGMPAEAVLRTMSTFEAINANDSTLVFWASVLAGSKTSFRSNRLRDTHALFTSAQASYTPSISC